MVFRHLKAVTTMKPEDVTMWSKPPGCDAAGPDSYRNEVVVYR
jgi:hypothetical protein